MLMDLMKDLKEIIINQFEENCIAYTNTEDIHVLLRKYFNTLSKKIRPIPRKVFISKELRSKKMPEEINAIFDEIKTEFEEGSDINPHLSKNLLDSGFDDRLYHSWGIYHLHLSNRKENESDFFYKRSDFLLFCIVDENDVYFIDILPHKEINVFLKQEMPEIIINNWPDLLEHCKVHGIKGASYTDEEIVQLRKNCINTFSSIDKDTYIPLGGGGLSLKGTNIKHFLSATYLIKEIRKIEELIIGNEDSIREEISKTVPNLPDNLDFYLFLEESVFVVKEINTGTYTYIFLDHAIHKPLKIRDS